MKSKVSVSSGRFYLVVIPILSAILGGRCMATDDQLPGEGLVYALQHRTYLEYNKPNANVAEILKADSQLATALGLKDASAVVSLFNASDEKSLAAAWEPIRSKLAENWYLSVTLDPLRPSSEDRLISVICGKIGGRETHHVALTDKQVDLDYIHLLGNAILDRKSFNNEFLSWTTVAPKAVVIYDDRAATKIKRWEKAKAHYEQTGTAKTKKQADADRDLNSLWIDIGGYLFAESLINTQDVGNLYLSLDFRALGQLEAANDVDFIFALQHSGLNESQLSDLMNLRGNLKAICDGDEPELALGGIGLELIEPPGQPHDPNQILIHNALMLELNYFGASFNGLKLKYAEQPADYKLDALLDSPVDRVRIRAVARKEVPEVIAELNARLLMLGAVDRVQLRAPTDRAAMLAVADHALRDFPDGYWVQMFAGVAYIQSEKRQPEGVRLLRHLADTCDVPHLQSMANCNLGRDLIQHRQFQEAIERLKLAIRQYPDEADSLFLLFSAQMGANKIEDARVTRERFLNVEPKGKRSEEVRSVVLPQAP